MKRGDTMKANWLDFKKRNWDARSQQERTVLKFAVWALTPVLIYFVLWQPARTAVVKLRSSVPLLQMQAEKLRIQAGEIETLRHRPQPALLDAPVLKTAVEETAARHQLREAITTLDLQPPNAVRVSFASVPFEQWLRWLQTLQQEQNIRADALNVVGLPQAGMVKISATLINGGAQ